MTHKDLVGIFNDLFSSVGVIQYWKKGKAAIRIRPDSCSTDLVFTYFTKDNWKVETLKMWENSVDGI